MEHLDARFTALAVFAIYGSVALLERIPSLRLRPSRLLRPFFATDVAWYAMAAGITLAFAPFFEGLAQLRADLGLPGLDRLELGWAAQVVIATVLYDLGTFLAHLVLHRFEFLWRLHKVHHSSTLLDWLATTRAHGLEHLFRGIPTQAVLLAIGLPASSIAAALAIYVVFATLGHSNLRLGLERIEWLFVTPRLHHMHHAPETTNQNFGTIFTIWDRLFGRLVVAAYDPDEILGVPEELSTYPQSWWPQLVEPFRIGRRRGGHPVSSVTSPAA